MIGSKEIGVFLSDYDGITEMVENICYFKMNVIIDSPERFTRLDNLI
mgnify:CR=1 FL=1